MIELHESSAVEAYEYDVRTQVLIVRAKWGKEYRFDDVPQWVVDQFLEAKSKGHYFHRMIRKYYRDKTAATEASDNGLPDSAPTQD